MSVTETLQHRQEALALLLEQFKGKTNIEGVLSVLMTQVQELEVVMVDLDTERRLANAVGEQLDGIGQIVGLPRGAFGDDDYRAKLRARIRANRSEGTPEDELETARLLLGATPAIAYEEFHPAAFVVTIDDALAFAVAAVAEELNVARAGGVFGSIHYTETADSGTFTFSDDDTFEASAAQGFANDAATAGGDFADAYRLDEDIP